MKPAILVIEDSKTHLKVILNLLQEFGFSVFHAASDIEGINLAKLQKPDLILLDLALPGIGGLEVCRRLEMDQETGQIPIIILTQKRKIEDKVSAFESGVHDFLTKPYHPEELKARILAALRMTEKLNFLQKQNRRLENQIEKIQSTSSRDSLTDLLNRKQFMLQLKTEFIRSLRYHLPLTLCFIDIDHLKTVNDRFGEAAGDAVLIEIAGLIQENFREIDFLCRFNQDDFLVGLPQSSPEDALIPLNRFQKQAVHHSFKSLPEECKVTISIGVSALPNPNIKDENNLFETALKALLKAKELGENHIVIGGEDLEKEKLSDEKNN